MAKRRRSLVGSRLGSSPEKHAKSLRSAERQVQKGAKRVIKDAMAGKCGPAFTALLNVVSWEGSMQAESRGMGTGKMSKKQSRRTSAGYEMSDRAVGTFMALCPIGKAGK